MSDDNRAPRDAHTRDGGPAFPVPDPGWIAPSTEAAAARLASGMSLRDYAAIHCCPTKEAIFQRAKQVASQRRKSSDLARPLTEDELRDGEWLERMAHADAFLKARSPR